MAPPFSDSSETQPVVVPTEAGLVRGERPSHRPGADWRQQHAATTTPWPAELLEAFSLRMASHGMSVSRAMMACDRRYALQQLSDAHNLADETLRLMAVQLFRHFESCQSGIRSVH